MQQPPAVGHTGYQKSLIALVAVTFTWVAARRRVGNVRCPFGEGSPSGVKKHEFFVPARVGIPRSRLLLPI